MSSPWPRHWYNYPIILCGVWIQYVWAIAMAMDPSVLNITAVNTFLPYFHLSLGPYDSHTFHRWILAIILFMTGTCSMLAFKYKRKLHTLLALVPQQFVLFLSAGGALHAIILGQFADGTVRSSGFLLADQSSIIILAVFHTWAMVLIMIHGDDMWG